MKCHLNIEVDVESLGGLGEVHDRLTAGGFTITDLHYYGEPQSRINVTTAWEAGSATDNEAPAVEPVDEIVEQAEPAEDKAEARRKKDREKARARRAKAKAGKAAEAEPEAATTDDLADDAPAEADREITLDMVKGQTRKFLESDARGVEHVKKVFADAGAAKATDIKPADYATVYAALGGE